MTLLSAPAQSEQLAKSLAAEVEGQVFVDFYHRALYSTDASLYQVQPLAVVVPRTQADVVHTLQIAAEQGVPIISRGGGTSLSGQSIGAGVVIDFSKFLNRVIELDAVNQTAVVEPGVVLDQLNAAAAAHGLQFGPEVATNNRANLGGMIGNNSAGARSILHGKVVDHVYALDVLLEGGTPLRLEPLAPEELRRRQALPTREGHLYRQIERIVAAHRPEIAARFPRVIRRVSGYNLDEFVPECRAGIAWPPNAVLVRQREQQRKPGAAFNLARLVVGAEGSLACVTRAHLHLVPSPPHRGIVVFEFDSLAHSVDAVNVMLESEPSAVEMFDGLILRLAERNLEYRRKLDFVAGRPESMLIVEFSGEQAEDVRRRAVELRKRLGCWPGVTHTLLALERELCDHIWACRKAAFPLLMSIPGDRKPITFVEDTAVDPRRLPEFTARFREILRRHGTDGAFYGHASVGCLHVRPLLDAANRDDLARLVRIMADVSDLVLEFGGAMSGEHGDGLARSFLNEKLFGGEIYRAFKEVKAAFDPRGLMNPGKVVDGPSPVENLRLGADHRRMEIATTLDFSREGGLARAAEACSGVGLCRKTRSGTMCPSFMATRDEEHSTRGRANALRLVLSGVLPPAEFSGRRLYETLDLCLQCKGCKAECPSNVDVAKMKAEFLDHYHRANGTPLGAWAMGHVALLNRAGSALAPVSNWIGRLRIARWLGEKFLGVDARRPLPVFQRQSFQSWFARRTRPSLPATRGPIVLVDDCLTSFCEPQVNRAAVLVLEAAGYEVHLAGLGCCGRAMISKGLLGPAQQLARRNVERLLPWALRGVPIVGCEPSCLLTLVDEYLDLVPGDWAREVAARATLIDTHLVRAGIELPLAPHARPLVVHGHCYQKALVGTGDLRAVLEQVSPDAPPRLLDAGCCGMAGSFGYEHYELSQQIGGRVLFPAVREACEATIVAPGFSCRHQIEHATGRRALHPIELLAECLSS